MAKVCLSSNLLSPILDDDNIRVQVLNQVVIKSMHQLNFMWKHFKLVKVMWKSSLLIPKVNEKEYEMIFFHIFRNESVFSRTSSVTSNFVMIKIKPMIVLTIQQWKDNIK